MLHLHLRPQLQLLLEQLMSRTGEEESVNMTWYVPSGIVPNSSSYDEYIPAYNLSNASGRRLAARAEEGRDLHEDLRILREAEQAAPHET